MNVRTPSIDLAKHVFLVHGVDSQRKDGSSPRVAAPAGGTFHEAASTLPSGNGACGGARYWAREIAKLGHEVRLMNPQFVRPICEDQ
jgi:transposase